jgi:hypothetical protein
VDIISVKFNEFLRYKITRRFYVIIK